MTIRDFHNNFDIEVDKTIDFEYPYILPEQKDYWINKSIGRFVKERTYPKNPNQKGFEETQKRIEDLRTLVVQSSNLIPTLTGTEYTITLPTDYLYLVRHKCTTADSTCGEKNVGGILTKEEFINQMIKDPFWKPTAEEPLYYFLGNTIVYETLGTFVLNNTKLTYIKQPAVVRLGTDYQTPTTDIQCDLPEQSHQEILDIAISMFLENIESQRYQTNLNELSKTE